MPLGMAFSKLFMIPFSCKLNMAGARWRIEAPVPLERGARYDPFLTDEPGADCTVRFRLGCPAIPENAEVVQERGPRVYRIPDGYVFDQGRATSPVPRARIFYRNQTPLCVEGWLFPNGAQYYTSLDHILETAGIEHLIAALEGLILHSSFITWQGDGILFSAPSGTGKSTQAALWEQYAAAEQINGDRAVLRCMDGVWTAFGFPFAGSSGIYKNKAAPVRAVVVLRQAPENTIERLPAGEAFRLLYSECAIQRWNAPMHAASVDRLIALTRAVPVYRLACTPDARAVGLLRRTLLEAKEQDL